MAQISGVEVQSIVNMYGVASTSIISIIGVETINLPGWPSAGPSCETWSMSYSSVSLADAVNNGMGINVEIGDNGIWYLEASCGNEKAETGYYFYDDRRRQYYWYWDAETQELSQLEPPAAGPTNTTSPSFGTSQLVFREYPTATRGTWTGTGNISYTYKIYSNDSLLLTQGPFPYTDEKGGTVDSPPQLNSILVNKNYLFTTIRLEVIATDDVGTTTEQVELKMTEGKLNTFLSNSGITDQTRIAALEYLQNELILADYLYDYNTSGPIIDYYPFAGETEYQNKWSLGKPAEYLNFSGNWSHNPNGSQTDNSTATSTKLWNNPNFGGTALTFGAYISNEVSEASVDMSLQSFVNTWSLGAKRSVSGIEKTYFTTPGRPANTDVDTDTSRGLFEIYHQSSVLNNTYYNSARVFNGTVDTTINTGFGQPANPNSGTFIIGGNSSTKNFQFAYNGWGSAASSTLAGILQTYNSMLGR